MQIGNLEGSKMRLTNFSEEYFLQNLASLTMEHRELVDLWNRNRSLVVPDVVVVVVLAVAMIGVGSVIPLPLQWRFLFSQCARTLLDLMW